MLRRSTDRFPLTASVAAALVALLATSSIAQGKASPAGPPQPGEERRTVLYKQGFDAASAGHWAEARERFAEALAVRASAKVYYSLAQAEEQLGQLGAASQDYARAIDCAHTAGERDVVAAAERELQDLEPRVPRLRVVVTGSSEASATLDGEPAPVGSFVQVDPGAHRIVVSAPGMRDAQATAAIGERQQLDVPVQLEPAVPAAAAQASAAPAKAVLEKAAIPTVSSPAVPAPRVSWIVPEAQPAPAKQSSSPWRTAGLVTAGTGLLAVSAGGYFGLRAKSKNDQSNAYGCSDDACSAPAAALRRDAITAANTSTVLFIVGGALTAGGVALWLLAPSRVGKSTMDVAPVALRGGGGLSLSGGW